MSRSRLAAVALRLVAAVAIGFPGEHVTTQIEAQATVVSWIAGRFAGRVAPTNC